MSAGCVRARALVCVCIRCESPRGRYSPGIRTLMFAYRPNDATQPYRDSEGLMGGCLAQCLPDHSGQRELCVVQWSKYNPVV